MLYLLACAPTEPSFVEVPELERAAALGEVEVLCAGLKMEKEGTRTEAAKHLAKYKGDTSCLCDRLVRGGAWDKPIVDGLAHAKKDENVGCVAKLMDDATLAERAALATALARLEAPAVQARLREAAKSDNDEAVRAAALAAYAKDEAFLSSALATEPSAKVRWAAAQALSTHPGAATALATAAKSDAEPTVRAMAITALRGKPEFPAAACAGLEDGDPIVRAQAATAMKGSKDEVAMTCLSKHALAGDADGTVRAAMLATLRSSPSSIAADALCDAIPHWVRTYIVDTAPTREGDADIVFAQNDRDFERSYDCVQKALRAGRYSCWGRAYLGDHFRELGGSAPVPRCDGGGSGGGGGGGGEIVF